VRKEETTGVKLRIEKSKEKGGSEDEKRGEEIRVED
jgi:hypothetical protein